MSHRRARHLGALALVVASVGVYAAPSASSAPPTKAAALSQANILSAHNNERAAVGTARLTWSTVLQGSAQSWANHLAAIHRLQHSGASGVGENIWMGTKGRFSDSQKVGSWTAEKKYFVPHKKFPDVSSTGRWQDVGHYTQVIWYSTRRVGCGQASDGSYDYFVCQYQPAGNIIGQYPLGHA